MLTDALVPTFSVTAEWVCCSIVTALANRRNVPANGPAPWMR